MSEIEKMYEKVGLASHLCKYPRFCDDNNCNECPNYSSEFTAEKQLSLMAFLINRKVGLSFKAEQGEITVEAISRGLAGIVNRIWQDLTESEQEQIRSILNG